MKSSGRLGGRKHVVKEYAADTGRETTSPVLERTALVVMLTEHAVLEQEQTARLAEAGMTQGSNLLG
jgi:hypothetical protein